MLATLTLLLAADPAFAGKVAFSTDGHAYNPVFSRDGRTIAFEVNSFEKVDLYLANLAGTEPSSEAARVELPSSRGGFSGRDHVAKSPVWHPDGILIFEASNPGGKYRLYYRQGSGGRSSELIEGSAVAGNVTAASLSADGHRVVFVTDASGQSDIQIRDTRTNALTSLTSSPEGESYPMFSADGSRVVFQRKQDGGEDIFEIEVASGVERLVVKGAGDQTRPVYAADGALVFFDGARGRGHWDLVSMIGGKRRVLASDVDLPLRARPALTPDGRYVAFTYSDPRKSERVMIARVDGSSTVAFETPFTAVAEPSFGVQGSRALLAYTALPERGADWRFLYVADVSDKIRPNTPTP